MWDGGCLFFVQRISCCGSTKTRDVGFWLTDVGCRILSLPDWVTSFSREQHFFEPNYPNADKFMKRLGPLLGI